MPVILAGSEAQKKKYLGRLIDEPLVASYGVTEVQTNAFLHSCMPASKPSCHSAAWLRQRCGCSTDVGR
jgi:hypothetical protein